MTDTTPEQPTSNLQEQFRAPSSWRAEDVIALAPEMAPFIQDLDKIDVEGASKMQNDLLDQQIARMQAIMASDAFRTFPEHPDPHVMAELYDQLFDAIEGWRRLATFNRAASIFFEKQSDQMDLIAQNTTQRATQFGELMQQSTHILGSVLQGQDHTVLEAMIEKEPRLNDYKLVIEKSAAMPEPDSEKIAALNPQVFADGLEKIKNSDQGVNEAEQHRLFGEGLSAILDFKQRHIEAYGFKNSVEFFEFLNSAPMEMMDAVNTSTKKHIDSLVNKFKDIAEFKEQKLHYKNTPHYTWDEAKDIVINAYAKLDPALGELTARAFDEGWVQARRDGVPNPFTLGSIRATTLPETHPFITTSFSGEAMDIVYLGHEMAHALAYHTSSQLPGGLSSPPPIVQESLTHLGEKFVEEEMLQRAHGEQKIRLNIDFLTRDMDALLLIKGANMEARLYDVIKEKGAAATYDDLQNAYKDDRDIKGNLSDYPGLWALVNQPPYHIAAYPTSIALSGALYEAWKENPGEFQKKHRDILEKGANVSVTQLWDTLLGGDRAHQTGLIEKNMEHLEAKSDALIKQLSHLPDHEPYSPIWPKNDPIREEIHRVASQSYDGLGHA